MFGDNLFVSLKYAYSDAGFSLTPMTDLDMNKVPYWDVTDQRYYDSQASRYLVERPVYQYNALVNYFNDSLFGASHDVKLGFEYATARAVRRIRLVGQLHDQPELQLADRRLSTATACPTPRPRPSPRTSTISPSGGAITPTSSSTRSRAISATRSRSAASTSSSACAGTSRPRLSTPFTVKAMDGGGAWDAIAPENVQTKLDSLLPAVSFDKIDRHMPTAIRYKWIVWSPRLGVTWDVTGDGKTLAKLSLAQYGDFMGTGIADRWRRGGVSGWFDAWWWDADHSGMMSFDELYWDHPADSSLYHIFDGAGNFTGDWNDAAGYRWGDYDNLRSPTTSTSPYVRRRQRRRIERGRPKSC